MENDRLPVELSFIGDMPMDSIGVRRNTSFLNREIQPRLNSPMLQLSIDSSKLTIFQDLLSLSLTSLDS
jgi:hypothetical protein